MEKNNENNETPKSQESDEKPMTTDSKKPVTIEQLVKLLKSEAITTDPYPYLLRASGSETTTSEPISPLDVPEDTQRFFPSGETSFARETDLFQFSTPPKTCPDEKRTTTSNTPKTSDIDPDVLNISPVTFIQKFVVRSKPTADSVTLDRPSDANLFFKYLEDDKLEILPSKYSVKQRIALFNEKIESFANVRKHLTEKERFVKPVKNTQCNINCNKMNDEADENNLTAPLAGTSTMSHAHSASTSSTSTSYTSRFLKVSKDLVDEPNVSQPRPIFNTTSCIVNIKSKEISTAIDSKENYTKKFFKTISDERPKEVIASTIITDQNQEDNNNTDSITDQYEKNESLNPLLTDDSIHKKESDPFKHIIDFPKGWKGKTPLSKNYHPKNTSRRKKEETISSIHFDSYFPIPEEHLRENWSINPCINFEQLSDKYVPSWGYFEDDDDKVTPKEWDAYDTYLPEHWSINPLSDFVGFAEYHQDKLETVTPKKKTKLQEGSEERPSALRMNY